MYRRKNLIRAVFFSLFFLLFFSCGGEKKSRIVLNEDFYWYETDENSSVWNAMTSVSRYLKLNDTKNRNLERLVEGRTTYVWVKAEFRVPDALKNMDLALVIPYVHFSSEVYINGIAIGNAGRLPPREMSTFYTAKYFDIGSELINQNGINTVYMKIFCMGKSTLAGRIFVGEQEDAKSFADLITFFRSTVYVFFVGLLFAVSLLFFMIFLSRRKNREYLSFAMMNFFTMLFLTMFFSGTVPVYDIFKGLNVSYTLYIKMFLCVNTYMIINCYVDFIHDFLNVKEKRSARITRAILVAVVSTVTFVLPSYESLLKSTPVMLGYCLLIGFWGVKEIAFALLNPEKRGDGRLLVVGLVPMAVAAVTDLVLHGFVRTVYFPFFSVVGWVFVIVLFISVLTYRFNRASIQNEYLNRKLKDEVALQTKNLTIANENLAKEIIRTQQDLEMASIVQKKYFPYPEKKFRGWDLAIDFEPLSNVSGDLYDYYSRENDLNGFALFDVSGHGLSASLITMLAKNIIASSFERGEKTHETVSETLLSINDKIISEKGDIDNYLTGILIKFFEFDVKDRCEVAMANAGHPYPLLFKKSDGSVKALKHDEKQKQYGAIGIQGIDVSFPAINFTMEIGDILVCYTDGLSEVDNERMEHFGYDRIGKVVQESCDRSATEIMRLLRTSVEMFANGVPHEDDLTIIVLKREDSRNFVEPLEQLEVQDDVEEI